MADAEFRGLDFSKEKVAGHYLVADLLAREERRRSEAGIRDLASRRNDYVKLAASSSKEDRDTAARMRTDLRFEKLNLWRATNVENFLKGEKCAPGSEFLAYAWLQEEREYLGSGLKYATDEKLSDVERIKLEDKELVAVSSCIVDMERRFPAGIPTFKATQAFLDVLPDLVQGPVNVAHGAVNKVFGR